MHADPPPNPAGLTSSGLLDRLKGRDQQAWDRFLHLYGPLVRGWCRAPGLRPEDVADVCQEVFRAVARGIGTFERPPAVGGAFRGWLRAVTRNCLHDHFRRRATQPEAVGGSDAQRRLQELPDLVPDDSAEALAAERAGVVRRALDLIGPEFAEHTWKAFLAVALDGRLAAEVARELGVSPFAVRQATYRVRRRLREELRELLD